MAEAIIGAQMRAHNPEPCPRLAEPVGCTATPAPQLPQAMLAAFPPLPALTLVAMTVGGGVPLAGVVATLRPGRLARRRGCTTVTGIARS